MIFIVEIKLKGHILTLKIIINYPIVISDAKIANIGVIHIL